MSNDTTNIFPIIAMTEKILSDKFSTKIHVDDFEIITEKGRRNLLFRCSTNYLFSNNLKSVIIKKNESKTWISQSFKSWDMKRFLGDWAGLQFLSDVSIYVPQFYGGDLNLGFIVIEDLGSNHRSLKQPLFEEDFASAKKALLEFACCLGKLQADTIDKLDIYNNTLYSIHPNAVCFYRGFINLNQLYDTLENFGLLNRQVLEEIESLIARIEKPGHLLAYIHGDPCPENVFFTNQGIKLIDFEFSQFAHAFTDIVSARMMFPTCSYANRIPLSIITDMENAYRIELSKICPEIQDERIFEKSIVDICAYWLLNTLGYHLNLNDSLGEDRIWGVASVRSRIISRLEIFITTSEKFNYLPTIRSVSSSLLDLLYKFWPEVKLLPLYPAFRTEGN
jgi:tRNA A-37 threonylcarbamoyl transferase component Bud32